MTFLAPWALVGLALLAIPIVVHLFKPRHVRQTPFSSLRWLHLTQQRMARRIQWHQVLLFLLRAGFLTLLVLALARPLWSRSGSAVGRDRIVVLDVSRSMGRQIEGRPRPIDAARALAVDALRGLTPGDRASVLLVGARTTVLAPWTTDVAPYLGPIEELTAGPTGTSLDSALDTIRSLLDLRRPGAAIDISVYTDSASGSWTPGGIAAFVESLSDSERASIAVRVIDVGLPAPRNAWLAGARLRSTPDGPSLRVEAACVGEAPQTRTLTADGLAGLEPVSTTVTIEPGRVSAFDLALPSSFDPRGSQVRLRLDPPDELPDDDEWFVDLEQSGGVRVLLVEPDSPAEESLRPGFPIRTAIQALADAGAAGGDARVTVRAPAAVTGTDIDGADVFVLADAPGLPSVVCDLMTENVWQGAGIVMFLGPSIDPENYNLRFAGPLRRSEALLPARITAPVQVPASEGGLAVWGRWNATHPLLAGLLDPLVGDLAATRSRGFRRFDGSLSPDDDVLAAFPDGTPALVARQVGAGRVVLVNASADDRSCDLPRRKSFVPLIDRLLAYLTATGTRRTFPAGGPLVLSLPGAFGDSPAVRSPSGAILAPRVEADPSRPRLLMRLDGLREAGFYTVTPTPPTVAPPSNVEPSQPGGAVRIGPATGNASAPITFVVQATRDDSPLARLDDDTLRSWWSPVAINLTKTAGDVPDSSDDPRIPLDPTLLLLAGALFVAEMFLIHWLCPRVNPALAAVGRRRGFVAPLKLRGEAP